MISDVSQYQIILNWLNIVERYSDQNRETLLKTGTMSGNVTKWNLLPNNSELVQTWFSPRKSF